LKMRGARISRPHAVCGNEEEPKYEKKPILEKEVSP
jgi:hypothetical protein